MKKVSKRVGIVKKSQSGSSLGMKSVKAGVDSNPGVTRADIITAGKQNAGKAQSGKKVSKKFKDLGGEIGRPAGPKGNRVPPTMGGAKNGKKVYKSGGAISYSGAGKATGFTGEGTYSPSDKNVAKSKKPATFKSGGKMGKCKGGC